MNWQRVNHDVYGTIYQLTLPSGVYLEVGEIDGGFWGYTYPWHVEPQDFYPDTLEQTKEHSTPEAAQHAILVRTYDLMSKDCEALEALLSPVGNAA